MINPATWNEKVSKLKRENAVLRAKVSINLYFISFIFILFYIFLFLTIFSFLFKLNRLLKFRISKISVKKARNVFQRSYTSPPNNNASPIQSNEAEEALDDSVQQNCYLDDDDFQTIMQIEEAEQAPEIIVSIFIIAVIF